MQPDRERLLQPFHDPDCTHIHEHDDCDCGLADLYELARAAGDCVHQRLLPAGNCHGELEQRLIDAHARYIERTT